jgi:hypothetical protein
MRYGLAIQLTQQQVLFVIITKGSASMKVSWMAGLGLEFRTE